MHYFYEPGIPDGVEVLNEDESSHCIRVFRLKQGDQIGLLDGQGGSYSALIVKDHPKKVGFKIIDQKRTSPPSYTIKLAIAPTKSNDRMEWLVEKLTELGYFELTLLTTFNSEKRKFREDRLIKKCVAALKQSKNLFMPKINSLIPLEKFIKQDEGEQRFIAYVDPTNPEKLVHNVKKNQAYTLLIGPEGDFSQEEVMRCQDAGYKKISLGNNTLRTETAALIGAHTLHLINS